MKILCVEDGSVDFDKLEDLQNGKVITYREGAKQPYVVELDAPNPTYKKMWETLKNIFYNEYDVMTVKYSAYEITKKIRQIEKEFLGE